MVAVRQILEYGGGRVIRDGSTEGDAPRWDASAGDKGGGGAAPLPPSGVMVLSHAGSSLLDAAGVAALRARWGSPPHLYSWVFDSVSAARLTCLPYLHDPVGPNWIPLMCKFVHC